MSNVFSKSMVIITNRKVQAIAYVIFMMAFASCGSTAESSDLDAEIVDSSVSKTTVYGIDAENVAIRTGPGRKFARLVNKTATGSLRETHYCELDYSTKVEILEQKGDWAKIKVVDPEWLSDTYIGWIPAAVTITLEVQSKQELGQLDQGEYEILRTDHNAAVQNFDVLLKRKKFDKAYAYQFIKAFRKNNCQGNCNVSLYDNITVEPLLGIYPLEGRNYLKMAEHLFRFQPLTQLKLEIGILIRIFITGIWVVATGRKSRKSNFYRSCKLRLNVNVKIKLFISEMIY